MTIIRIFFLFAAIIIFFPVFADNPSLTPASINAPKTPGTYGAQKLDWNISDTGSVAWNIPFQFPATKQLPLKLSLNYTPTSSLGEGGNFWNLSISKVLLDKKRGVTKFLNSQSCSTSQADNLYVDGTHLISIRPGVWASIGNSGKNILRCNEIGGFNYYNSDGAIYSYGVVPESRIETPDGKATQWYLSKITTFSGSGEIDYKYSKPQYKSSDLKLMFTTAFSGGFVNDESLVSIPLLQEISSDDVSADLTYEKNNFIEPDTLQGFMQVMADRIAKVTILKNNNSVRSYDFEYETSALSGRLISVKMFDTNHTNSMPVEVFNYRGLPFQSQGTIHVNATKRYAFGNNDYQFVDFLGDGIPQKIYLEGGQSITHYYQQYSGTDLFSGSNLYANLTAGKLGQIIFTNNVHVLGGGDIKIANATFADMAGHGSLDWIDLSDVDRPNPIIFLNDFQKDANGNVIIQRGITLKREDVLFLSNAGCTSAAQLKFGDFTGSGRSDILCVNTDNKGTVALLINKGFSPNTNPGALPGQYILNTQQFRFSNFFNTHHAYDFQKEIRVVDWNNDGLADIVAYSSTEGLTIFLNNGKLGQGDLTGDPFTPVYLGTYHYFPADLTQVAFADLTGSGLPDIIVPTSSSFILYMNNGIGKPLSEMQVDASADLDISKLQVISLNGSGKKIIMAPSSHANVENILFDLDLPSFPNMLSSVLSADGRLIHFDYSTPQMERVEAANFDNNQEIKNYSSSHYLLPYLFPLIKQVSVSDGFNPTKVTRYAYRAPSYDKSLAKFLDFGLVRKLNVGDVTQPSQLFEYRFLSGFRKSLEDGNDSATVDNKTVEFNPRLSSEISAFNNDSNTQQIISQCENVMPFTNSDSSLTGEGNEWCTNLSGFRYETISGMAENDEAVFTGNFSSTENITTTHEIISPSLFTNQLLQSQGTVPNKNELAQILTMNSTSIVSGQGYDGNNNAQTTNSTIFSYDNLNRQDTSTSVNEAARNNDNAVVKTEYFCPGSHSENASIYCNLPSLVTKNGQGGETISKMQYTFDLNTGLLLEIYGSNANGELKKQAWVDSYDTFGRMNNFFKATGEHVHFDWSQINSNLNSTTDEDGVVTSAQYDNYGDVVHIENTHGSVKEFQYDSFLRLIEKLKNKTTNGNLIASTTVKSSSFFNTAKVFLKEKLVNIVNTLSNFISSTTGLGLVQTDKIEYSFPQINKINSFSTAAIQDYIRSLETSAKALPEFPIPSDFTSQTSPTLEAGSITLGYVNLEHRNDEKEELKLVSKIWLSGADEEVFEANRLDDNNFSLANKSARNKLGAVYQDFLNAKISDSDVTGNILPNFSSSPAAFQLRSSTNYFSDGSPKSVEFAEGQIITYVKGANFNLSISPEGRRSRSLYNEVGELISKQTGLDDSNQPTSKSHIMNMNYDAFHRLISVTDNDGLIATQHFAANGKTDFLKNNKLGLAHYFYDDENRLLSSNLCPLKTLEGSCLSSTENTVLEKSFAYDVTGKLLQQNSYRFNRLIGTNSHDITDYFYGKSSSAVENGLLNGITITSLSDLGVSKSVQNLFHNEEGVIVSKELELFLGNNSAQLSVGQYDVDKNFDLSGNLISTNTRGGLPGQILSQLASDNVTGTQSTYLSGSSILEKVAFSQNGTITSTPLTGIVTDAEGYITNLHLENNLEMAAAWHPRKQVPLAFWAGDTSQLPQDLSTDTKAPGLFHQRWDYDKDLYPIASNDASGQQVDNVFSGNSQFSYDNLGRLVQSTGDWGQIHYEYSPGGKINTVTRSGLFVANRMNNGQSAFVDIYNYSKGDENTQDGVLNSVSSTDGKVTANLNYHSDSLGFREFGVAPTLSVLASGSSANPTPTGNDSAPWTSYEQIPMQKYVWNGNGLLQGVYAAVAKDDKATDVDLHDLLAYRMFDESGNLLAEFDGVQIKSALDRANSITNNDSNPQDNSNSLALSKLPRLVNVDNGISFERDEIHINLALGSFASLDLITRYPNLNSTSPKTITNVLQTRKELRISDHVGSTSIVIDIDSKKIVERNASEPFGLERGIPLISNSVIPQFSAQGRRADAQLYQNSQGNMRANWPQQGFEAVSSNANEMQGMRNSEHFALGKFSAQTGLHSMGVRTYDSARGLWMSPDLVIGQSLEMMVKSEQEANLFQYAANNPVAKNDPFGKDTNEENTSESSNNNPSIANGGGGYSLGAYGYGTGGYSSTGGYGPSYGFGGYGPSYGIFPTSSFDMMGSGAGIENEFQSITAGVYQSALNGVQAAYGAYQRSPTAQTIVTDISIGLTIVAAVMTDGASASIESALEGITEESAVVSARIDVGERVLSAGEGAEKPASSIIKVIGRLGDTNVAKEWDNHDVLNIPKWSIEKNDQWVQEGINNNQKFYTASPETIENLINQSGERSGEETVFGRELRMIKESGYKKFGDYYSH